MLALKVKMGATLDSMVGNIVGYPGWMTSVEFGGLYR